MKISTLIPALSGIAFLSASAVIIACSSPTSPAAEDGSGDGSGGGSAATYRLRAEVLNDDTSRSLVTKAIVEFKDTSILGPVSAGANITVNGQTLSKGFLDYRSEGLAPIDAGSTAALVFSSDASAGGLSYQKTLVMPKAPLNENIAGARIDPSQDYVVTWDKNGYSTSAPTFVFVRILHAFTRAGIEYDSDLISLNKGSFTIPAGTLATNADPVLIKLIGVNAADIGGSPYESGAHYWVGNTKTLTVSTK